MDPLLTIALGMAALLFLGLAFHNRALALAAFCALLPTYLLRFSIPLPGIGGVPSTFLELLFGALFLAWLATDVRQRTQEEREAARQRLLPWVPALGLLLLGATIGVGVAPDVRAALGVWRAYFVEPVLFFVLFTDVVRTPRHRNMIIAGLGLALVVAAVAAVYQKLTGDGIPNPYWAAEATRRATSLYGYPNAIGLFGAPVVVLLAGRALSLFWRGASGGGTTLRAVMLGALAFATAALGAVGIFFAVSEGALIGLAAGLLALGLLLPRTRAVALGLVIAGCIAVLVSAPLMRYATGIVGLRDSSSSVRAIVWTESWHLLADHAVFGAGLSGYPLLLGPYHLATHIEIFQYPHTLFMNFWSEVGLVGTIGFVWLLVLFFRDAWHLRRAQSDWLRPALVAAMVALLVHGLVDVPYFKNDLAFLFFILLGLMAGMRAHPVPASSSQG